jgi:hypothetical protein
MASEARAAASVSSGSGTPTASSAAPPISISWNRSSNPAAQGNSGSTSAPCRYVLGV